MSRRDWFNASSLRPSQRQTWIFLPKLLLAAVLYANIKTSDHPFGEGTKSQEAEEDSSFACAELMWVKFEFTDLLNRRTARWPRWASANRRLLYTP